MIENRITPACPYIFPSARRRSGMAARQVRRSVVIRNLQIRLLAMDSDRTPLGKGKDVLHGAARAAPLRQSVEQPWSLFPLWNPRQPYRCPYATLSSADAYRGVGFHAGSSGSRAGYVSFRVLQQWRRDMMR